MLVAEFSQICDLLREPVLLVTGTGEVVAANSSAVQLIQPADGAKLHQLFDNDDDSLRAYLRNCSRSRTPIRMTLKQAQANGKSQLFRCDGALLEPRSDDAPALLMLVFKPHDTGNLPFRVLNEKIEELDREINRRKATEATLQEHLALSEFGREFGLALSKVGSMDEMLASCVESLVKHLDAAFARIWVVDEAGETLVLRASAGMYTHLDGGHSRVPIGQLKIGMIAESQTPHLTNEVVGDPRVNEQEWAQREGMVAFAGYPLIVDGATVGVMAMFARHPLADNVLLAMASVSNELAVGIRRKHAETELVEKAEALELANTRKNEFLAMLAHELRNPLAPVRAGLELLAADDPGNDVIHTMRPQLDHIVRIVDDLLDVSRIMRGRIEMRRQPVALQQVIDRSVAAIRPALEEARHSLKTPTLPSPLWIHGDEVRLTQVLTNVIHNAVKYTPDGGAIEMTVDATDSEVSVTVVDNGIGFAPEFAPELFTLFTQANQALDRSQGGLGIGLTLVKQIVVLHGGRVEARSDGHNQGSTFTIYLPLCAVPPDHVASEQQASVIPPMRVLVVDDNLASAKMVSRLIERSWEHTLSQAHDGEQALVVAREADPEVIFLDIGLPKLDGFAVARKLREQPQFAKTFIVALTGYGREEDRKISAEAGCNMHLVKPIAIDDLRNVFTLAASARSNDTSS